MNFHKYANLFPLLSDTALATLAANIKEVGLFDPITLYQGSILDGRNRYRATQLAGVEPRYVDFVGTDEEAMEFSYSRNFHRRDLTTGQRAAIASEWATMKRGGEAKAEARKSDSANPPNHKSNDQSSKSHTNDRKQESKSEEKKSRAEAAKKFETSDKSIGDFRFIQKHRPDLAEKVSRGEMTINAAKVIVQRQLADRKRDEEEAEAKAKHEAATAAERKRAEQEKARQEAQNEREREKRRAEAEAAKAEKKRLRDDHIRRVAERFAKRLDDENTKARSESGGIHKNVKDKLVSEEYTSWKFMIRSPIDFKLEPNDPDDTEFHLIDACNWIGVIPGTSWSVVEFVCRRLLSKYRNDGDDLKADLTMKSFDMLRQHKRLFNESHSWEVSEVYSAKAQV